MSVAHLTQCHLEKHFSSQLDKDSLVYSYLRDLQRHMRAFAAEGKEKASSWTVAQNQHTPQRRGQGGTTTAQAETFGFDTPVLKPRVSRRGGENLDATTSPRKSGPKDKSFSRKTNDSSRHHAPTRKACSEKHPVTESSGDDRKARMTERRERKRVKRSILRPSNVRTCEDGGSENVAGASEEEIKKKPKGRKNKKQNVINGLALMHGFTATNIGKNRLTLKPPVNFGVFNKGKASVKIHVDKQKSGAFERHFSESRFLNGTRKNALQVGKDRRSRPRSETTASERSSRPASGQRHLPRQYTKFDNSNGGVTSPTKQRKASSEVWAIEVESPKPTCVSSVQPSRAGTVVLGTDGFQWADAKTRTRNNLNDKPSSQLEFHRSTDVEETQNLVNVISPVIEANIGSSSSLGPSQSASQLGRQAGELRPPDGRETVSRYFTQCGSKDSQDHISPKFTPVTATDPEVPSSGVPPAALHKIDRQLHIPIYQESSMVSHLVRDENLGEYKTTQIATGSCSRHYASSLNSLQLALEDPAVKRGSFDTIVASKVNSIRNHPVNHSHDYNFVTYEDYDEELNKEYDYDGIMQHWRLHSLPQQYWLESDAMDLGIENDEAHDVADNGDPLRDIIEDDRVVEEHHFPQPYDHDGDLQDFPPCLGTADTYWMNSPVTSEEADQFVSRPGTGCTYQSSGDFGSEGLRSSLDQFCQGRTLLRGTVRGEDAASKMPSVLRAEADVARCLKGHWQPYRL